MSGNPVLNTDYGMHMNDCMFFRKAVVKLHLVLPNVPVVLVAALVTGQLQVKKLWSRISHFKYR